MKKYLKRVITFIMVFAMLMPAAFAYYNNTGSAQASQKYTGPGYAIGNGEELFEGYYDNTDIYSKLAEITNIE
ncbi:MAG: hypothetical protein K0S76_767 [Herbinix sp.]|jgi:hypothetical protein|nr:hypothetical protein [Herbinix sp.]